MRTEVGIVEWAGRVHSVVALHRALADALGRGISDAAIDTRYQLLDRARRHGWCADEWTTVAPVLHDVEPDGFLSFDHAPYQRLIDHGAELDGSAALTAELMLGSALVTFYRRWRDEVELIADAPYGHVIDRVLHELDVGPEL